MKQEYGQTKAKCPFFQGSSGEKHFIRCTGIGNAASTLLTYRTERQRKQQLAVFCQDCYANCEVYRMVIESQELDDPQEQ